MVSGEDRQDAFLREMEMVIPSVRKQLPADDKVRSNGRKPQGLEGSRLYQ